MNQKQREIISIRIENFFCNGFTVTNKIIFLTIFFILFVNNLSFSQQYKVYQEKEFKSMNKVLKITADKSTFDKNYGDSYRVLRIFLKLQENTLKEMKKHILPISYRFPDYPYSFSASFEGEKNFVVIRENSSFFIYDLIKDQLSKQIVPKFKEAEYADAQSGMITSLKIDHTGKYLIGHAQDMGDFFFGLSNLLKPQQLKKTEIPSIITTISEAGSKIKCEPYTPVRGTAERKAILDALREEVYRIQKLKVVFVVPYLKVFNGWAWVETRPQSPDGSNHYEDVLGLIHKKNGAWEVLEIFFPGGDGPGCCADEEYFKKLIKKFSEIPYCILPINNK